MKRTALILMTMLSVATLVGCGGTSSDDTSTSVSSSEDIPTEEIHQTKIVTYDGPSIMETSANVAISVNDNSLFVYETRVNHGRVFTFTAPKTYAPVAYFDFVGSVTVKVEILNPLITLSKAVVRPLYLEIDPQITENVIEFTIDYPADYTIEFNDDTEKAIHLFANPLEVDPIDPEHIPDDVTYIGPGAYSAGAIPIASNKTIYLAGGAFVYGQIRGEMLENVTIRGRGILSGAIYDRKTESESTIPLEFRFTNNIQIDGISILDPAGWAMLFYNCENVLVNDVKIITARANGDGISVQGSRHVDVIGGFVRTWDDSLVVKNMAGYCSEDVYFKNVVIWTDLAQSMEIGFESRGEYLKDIVFENITILHNFHKSAMSIHLADDALVSNVTYRNITLEDGQMLGDNRIDGQDDYFIDISIEYNIAWSTSGGELGSIAGVHFENVKVHQVADSIVSRIRGDSDTSTVSNVSFRNVDYAGVLVNSAEDLKIATNDKVSNITYQSASPVHGAIPAHPYILDITNPEVIYTNIPSITQAGLIVPEFAKLQGDLPYKGAPLALDATAVVTHGAGLLNSTPADDGSGDYADPTYPAINAIDNNHDSFFKALNWKNEVDEFACLEVTFAEPMYFGSVRLFADVTNEFAYEFVVEIRAKRVTDGVVSTGYTKLLSQSSYELSPAQGNAIDINVTPYEYKAVQFRIFAVSGMLGQKNASLTEVEFYQPSLSFQKAIVDATAYNDVYVASNLVDGNPATYYESAGLPATVVIDLAGVYDVRVIVLQLVPKLVWDPRNQEIEILASNSNLAYNASSTSFTSIMPRTSYLFDPALGNTITIDYASSISMRYLKLVIYSNDIAGGYDAQLSEVSVFA